MELVNSVKFAQLIEFLVNTAELVTRYVIIILMFISITLLTYLLVGVCNLLYKRGIFQGSTFKV